MSDDNNRDWTPVPLPSEAWEDIMVTQGFLRDDPREWGIVGVSRYDEHYLEVYVGDPIDATHEGELIPSALLAFMAGRGWQVKYIGIGQSPQTDEWVPKVGFARGPEIFDSLVNHEVSVTPDDDSYDWQPLVSEDDMR